MPYNFNHTVLCSLLHKYLLYGYECQGNKETCWVMRAEAVVPHIKLQKQNSCSPQVPRKGSVNCHLQYHPQWFCISREPKPALVPPSSWFHPGILQHPHTGSSSCVRTTINSIPGRKFSPSTNLSPRAAFHTGTKSKVNLWSPEPMITRERVNTNPCNCAERIHGSIQRERKRLLSK